MHPYVLISADQTAAPIATLEILLALAELRGRPEEGTASTLQDTSVCSICSKFSFSCFVKCRQIAGLQLGTERSTAQSLVQLCLQNRVRCRGHHLRCLPSYLSFA